MGILFLDDIREIMFNSELYETVFVEGLMHSPPEKIFYEKDKMNDIMQKFQESGAWNLPVIKDGIYHGFISKSKLLTAYRRELINHTRT